MHAFTEVVVGLSICSVIVVFTASIIAVTISSTITALRKASIERRREPGAPR